MDRYVVFTDLDGTLLDHDTYSVRGAVSALDLLISIRPKNAFANDSGFSHSVAPIRSVSGCRSPP